MAEVAVVHLVRRRNDPAHFERFLASYREHPAGLPHELVLIFKGFALGRGTEPYDKRLAGEPHRRLYVADHGFDVRAYFVAAAALEHRYLCFLNSFSRILAPDWLAMLYRAAATQGAGVAGATASYESIASSSAERNRVLSAMDRAARLRWRIDHVLKDRQPRVVAQRGAAWALGSMGLWDPARYFPPFPNYHIRTNAFMVARETFLRVRTGPVLLKLSAYRFESGHYSLTNQIARFGLRPLLVGRDGRVYEKAGWHLADTFRQARQENLMVADNQTDAYAAADAAGRRELSRLAWGEHARPAGAE